MTDAALSARPLRTALLQLRVDDSEPVSDRRSRVVELVRQQRDVDLVVLPELWPVGAFASRAFADAAEPLDGPTAAAMAAAARDIGAHVLAGSIVERDGDDLFNTALLFDPSGALVRHYRKVHLFGFAGGESRLLRGGGEVAVHEAAFGRLGITTCYDLRFPELYRLLVDAGSELLVVPTGWPSARLDHWLLLARARAVENQAFVLGCNQVGSQHGVEMAGHSIVVDPWGEVVAEAGDDEQVLRVDLDLADVQRTREAFPVLNDRRIDVKLPTQ